MVFAEYVSTQASRNLENLQPTAFNTTTFFYDPKLGYMLPTLYPLQQYKLSYVTGGPNFAYGCSGIDSTGITHITHNKCWFYAPLMQQDYIKYMTKVIATRSQSFVFPPSKTAFTMQFYKNFQDLLTNQPLAAGKGVGSYIMVNFTYSNPKYIWFFKQYKFQVIVDLFNDAKPNQFIDGPHNQP